jgi:hypothetical protein
LRTIGAARDHEQRLGRFCEQAARKSFTDIATFDHLSERGDDHLRGVRYGGADDGDVQSLHYHSTGHLRRSMRGPEVQRLSSKLRSVRTVRPGRVIRGVRGDQIRHCSATMISMVTHRTTRRGRAAVVLKRAAWSGLVGVIVTGLGCFLPLPFLPLILPGLVPGCIYGFFFDEPRHQDGWAILPLPTCNGTAFLIGNIAAWGGLAYLCLSSRSKRPKPGQGTDDPLPHPIA